MEQKIIRFCDTAIRSLDGDQMTVEGYALKFDKETLIGGKKWGFREKISKRALDSADLSNVILNFNHDVKKILAGTRNQSLSLTVDDIGVRVSATIVDTAYGRDIYKLISENLINRMSFSATITKSEWTEGKDEQPDLREITEFGRFYDVSAVTFPAYEDTSIMSRAGDNGQEEVYYRQIGKLNKILRRDENV